MLASVFRVAVSRVALTTLFFILCADFCTRSQVVSQDVTRQAAKEPSKADLIKTLDAIQSLFESKEYEKAISHFSVPAEAKPEQLTRAIERVATTRELSTAGIRQLESDAKFGKIGDLFGEEVANQRAKRASVNVNLCYGFRHESKGVTAQVIGVWDGKQFKIVALDDVGKLSGDSAGKKMPVETAGPTREPTKADLIGTLDSILPLLENRDCAAAAKFVLMPPGMDPEELGSTVKNRELSAAGIRQLEKDAKFGTAIELFGKDRATGFAKRMGGDVTKCFGFNHETENATAEVIGQWDGQQFKLVRIDDVGKLETPMKTELPETPKNRAAAEAERQLAIQKAVEMIQELETKIKDNPDDFVSRAQMAMEYNQIGNFPAAWEQLVVAYKLKPSHSGIARGIDVLMSEFSNRGVFTVGVPSETIKGLLGEPRQTVPLGDRDRWVYGHWGVDLEKDRVAKIVDLRKGKVLFTNPTETVSTDLGGEPFRVGFRQTSAGNSLAFLFIPGETMSEFKQRITLERLIGLVEYSDFKSVGHKLIEQAKSKFPGSSYRVLEENEDSMIVAAYLPGQGTTKTKHQLVRMMRGAKDLHRITYTLVSDEKPSQEIQIKWLKIFQDAKLKRLE